MPNGLIFYEEHKKGVGLFIRAHKVFHSEISPIQKIDVIYNEYLGKVLLLDGLVMLTERDEFIYHEMIVHPAFLTHPNPRRVLIAGGGDGGTLREVLRYNVDVVFLVEIDRRVTEVSKKFFPDLAVGFNDPRTRLIFRDAYDFIKETNDKFDIVIVDSTDPIGHAKKLFEKDFFKEIKRILKSHGIVVAQTESPFYHIELMRKLKKAVIHLFKHTHFYITSIPTYPGGIWSFLYLSDECDPNVIKGSPPQGLRFYNPNIHKASFSIPNFIKNELEE